MGSKMEIRFIVSESPSEGFCLEVVKMESGQEGDRTDWLAVVELSGNKYVVDIEQRQFRKVHDPSSVVSFYCEEGRKMIRAMADMDWRAYTPRELWEKRVVDRELVV